MKRILAFVLILIAAPVFYVAAETNDDGDVDEMEQMKRSIQQLQDKVEKLQQQVDVKVPPEEGFTDGKGTPKHISQDDMQIEYRESFNDKQEAAPRPYDLTMDPTYQGFIPIPHTHGMIKFNARPRVDFTNDNTFTGNEDRFVTAVIPVTGEATKGGGHQFNVNSQGTQLSMDVRAPGLAGSPRFYYENDFSGTCTSYMCFKVRHLYGVFFNFIVGQTYTVFEDADAWPDTVDYEGPNAAISARRPLIRYMLVPNEHWGFAFSLEKPDGQVDTTGDVTATSEDHAPDGGFYIKWMDKKYGHVQLSAIFRDIAVSSDAFGNQSVFGWGVNLSANANLFKNDSFQTMVTYGQGIYYFMNDAVEFYDAAFNAEGRLRALPVIAVMAGYTHDWGRKFRSTGSFGFVNLENQAMQAWNAYHRTYYASLNLVYQLYSRLSFGVEGLYGYKQVKSHASGQAWRGQFTIMYALFR